MAGGAGETTAQVACQLWHLDTLGIGVHSGGMSQASKLFAPVCIYCWERPVVGDPVTLLACGPCLLEATMLGRWRRLMFDLAHGPIVLLALLCCLLGCSEAPSPESSAPGPTPTLKVSTALSPALQAAVVAAAADWQAAGFELAIEPAEALEANLRPGSCAELADEGQVAPACAWPRSHILLDLKVLEACRWVKRGGLTQCLRLEPTDVIRHELGHWLGLGYHLPDGNVMQAHYDAAGGYPQELTTLDIEATRAALVPQEK